MSTTSGLKPTNLKPTQPVYFNLNHQEDKEFWDDIHSDKIPNFTKWVKTQWIEWKGLRQSEIQVEQIDKQPNLKIVSDDLKLEKPEIKVESASPKLEYPLENSKRINANSLTKMFGIK